MRRRPRTFRAELALKDSKLIRMLQAACWVCFAVATDGEA